MGILVRAVLAGIGLVSLPWPSLARADDATAGPAADSMEASPDPTPVPEARPRVTDPCDPAFGRAPHRPRRGRFTPVTVSLGPRHAYPRRPEGRGGFVALAVPHAAVCEHAGIMLGGYARTAGTLSGGMQAAAVARADDYVGVQLGLVTLAGTPLPGKSSTVPTELLGAQVAALVAHASNPLGAQLAGIGARAEYSVGTQIGGVYAYTDWIDGVQIGGLVARTQWLSGLQLGGVLAHAADPVGVQLGGVLARAEAMAGVQISAGMAVVAPSSAYWSYLMGVQIAGLVAHADGHTGAQLAGILARSGEVRGLQLGGLGAVAGTLHGVQLGGVFTFEHVREGADAQGQLAGVLNVTIDRMRGVQLASLSNYAGAMRGMQLSAINVTDRDHQGLQLGATNYASTMKGVQIGLLNITGELRGFQLGLLNLARKGGARVMPLVNVGWRRRSAAG